MCALILYQCYAQTEKNDSAALWLSRIPLTQEKFRGEAVAFFQRTGYLVKADSVLKTLPASFMRDTLSIRSFLFAKNVKGAAAEALRVFSGAQKSNDKNDALLWRIRTLMFGGSIGAIRGLLDSITFDPRASGAREILGYKYALFVLETQPSAWGDFGSVAFASWAELPDIAYKTLQSSGLDGYSSGVKQFLILYCAKTLIAGKVYFQALKVLERLALSEASAEYRYYYADVLAHTGSPQQARQALEDIVLKFPSDVFSERARIALMQLGNKN